MPSNYDYIPGAQGTRNSLQGGSSITSAGRSVPQPYGNRYIPPTFNFGRDQGGGRPNYDQMDWNNIQGYNLPQHGNNPYAQEYMGGLHEMLGNFQGRYPQQQPRMPQFGGGDPYNMHDMLQSQRGPQGLVDRYSVDPDLSQFEGPMYDLGGRGYASGRGGFDPRALMAQMFRGMSPEMLFSGGNFGQQQRPRPKYPDFANSPGSGGAGPPPDLVGGTKPYQLGGGG